MRARAWRGVLYSPESVELLKNRPYKYLIISQPYLGADNLMQSAFLVVYFNAVHNPTIRDGIFNPVDHRSSSRKFATDKGILFEDGIFKVDTRDKIDWEYYLYEFNKQK